MDDFASVAMMRVVREGLRRQGLPVPALPPSHLGRVALPDKRAQLDALWQAHGPLAIARLGEAVQALQADPLGRVFAQAHSASDLLHRWQRLERFVHSRHRVVLIDSGPQHLRWRHESLRASAPPTPAENLLVAGLLLALVHALPAVPGLRARPVDQRRWWFDGHWQLPAGNRPVRCNEWEWAWTRPIADPAPASAGPDGAVGRVLALLEQDPARGWTLPDLARTLRTSPRTLQRLLARDQCRYSGLLAQARLNHAARWLTDSAVALAEVGYASGYADQPHFARQFRAHTGLTPAQYRAQFGRPPAGRAALSRSASRR